MSHVTGTHSDTTTEFSLSPARPEPGASLPRRADALRNRGRILEAAARLFTRDGVQRVTMQAVAREAGVGVGTLYRGFTDKAGLAMALLGERERQFQELMIFGPPPLGPGAEPVERLTAFVAGYVALVAEQLDLVLLSQTAVPGTRFRSGAHALWHQHCRYLFQLTGTPSPGFRADALLAALSSEMVAHWLTDQRWALTDLTEELMSLSRALSRTGRLPQTE